MSQIKEFEIKGFDLSEIINGEDIMGPSPFGKHQRIIAKLHLEIAKFLESCNIGEVLISPLDVIFEENINRLQPDLIFVKKENFSIIQDWIRGVPDMVVEVVSKGSLTQDTVIKKEIYEKYGVSELWLVFPEEECIEIFAIKNKKYALFSAAEGVRPLREERPPQGEGMVRSSVIDKFKLDIRKIFEGIS